MSKSPPRSRALLALLLVVPALAQLAPVAAASEDWERPVVTGWSLNAASFEPGDALRIDFNVSDASHVRTVLFSLHHEESRTLAYRFGERDVDRAPGAWNASFTWEPGPRGNYTLEELYVEDVHGNAAYLFRAGGAFPEGAPYRVFLGPSGVDVELGSLVGPSSASYGDVASYQAAVRNLGDRAAGPFNVTAFVDGAPLRTERVESLGSGALRWIPFNWTAQPGSHFLQVRADSAGELDEADETNNARNLTVAVNGTSGTDLTIHLGEIPQGARPGDVVRLNATVRNVGATDAGPFDVSFRVDGDQSAHEPLASLAGGASVVASFAWTAQGGFHTLSVHADPRGNVTESDEGNNEARRDVMVGGEPNLVTSNLTFSPASPTEGETIHVGGLVRNAGNASAGPFAVSLLWNGREVASTVSGGLSPGAAAQVWFATQRPAGNHTLGLLADAGGSVAESREDDNLAQAHVAVRPKDNASALPDLVVGNVTTPWNLTQGRAVLVKAPVINVGHGASGAFRASLLVNGTYHAHANVTGLGVGGQAWVSFPWTPTRAGPHALSVVADTLGNVTESDEGNNARNATVHVNPLPPADLGVRIVEVRRVMMRTELGELVPNPLAPRTLVVEVANHGPNAGEGALNVSERTPGVEGAGAQTRQLALLPVAPLATGAARTYEVEWSVADVVGDVTVVARVEGLGPDPAPANDVDEHDEFVHLGGSGYGLSA